MNPNDTRPTLTWIPRWPIMLIILIGIMQVWYGFYTYYIGDDIGYAVVLHQIGGILHWPHFAASHWLHVNGRLASMMAPLPLALPMTTLCLLNGGVIALSYYFTVRASGTGPHTVTARITLIALLLFTLPWWDSPGIFDVAFNYPWVVAFTLGALLWIHHGVQPAWRWLACLLAFAAGSMHEAAGVPLCCGLTAYFYLSGRWHTIERYQRVMIILFAAGAFLTVTAPSIWGRFNSDTIPDDPMWLLLLKSDFYAIALVVLTAILYVCDRGRIRAAARTPWVLFAVAAVASMTMSAVGGIVGRSGWFAQTFALIAIFQLAKIYGLRISRTPAAIISTLFSGLILLHLVDVARWQRIIGNELIRSMEIYAADPREPVFMDYTPTPEQPARLLNKTRGVIVPAESYMIKMTTEFIGDSIHPYIVLPEAARQIPTDTISSPVSVGDSFISPYRPDGTNSKDLYTSGGRHYLVMPFTRHGRPLYFITPIYLPPGSRLHEFTGR